MKVDNAIKVLHISDEEFYKQIDKDCFFIEVRDVKISWQQESSLKCMNEEEVLENINHLIGILNIKECKDFVFTYGERKFEAPDVYNQLLIDKLINSDEVTNIPINIVRYYYDDCLDNGIKVKVIIGYDIDTISINTTLYNGAIINTPLENVLVETPITNDGDVQEHQIIYNDYGVIIESDGEFYTQKEFWQKSIGTDCSNLFLL